MQSKTKPYFNFWDSVCDWNGIQAKMVNADFQWNLNASSYLSVFLSKILRNNTKSRFARVCILFVSAQPKSKYNKIEFCILFAFHLFVLQNELEVLDMKPRWTNNVCMYIFTYIVCLFGSGFPFNRSKYSRRYFVWYANAIICSMLNFEDL